MKPTTYSKWMLALMALAVVEGIWAQERMRIANEGTIGDKWMLADGTTLASAVYPAHFAGLGASVCIALAYTINPDGKTTDFAVAKQWNSKGGEDEPVDGFWQAFAVAGSNAVSQWRFRPRPEVVSPVPTRTVATLGFTGQANVDAAELRSHCEIADLADRLSRIDSMLRERDYVGDQLEGRRREQARLQAIQERLKQANQASQGNR